jgi:hypothetical protein
MIDALLFITGEQIMISKRALRTAQRKRTRKLRSLVFIIISSALLLIFGSALARQYLPVSGAVIEVTGSPSLKVDRDKIDLGDVRFETPVSVSFQITNVGDKPLKFVKTPDVEVVEGC